MGRKRWAVSQKRRTKLYAEINDSIMDLRVCNQQNKLDKHEVDEKLFKLNQEIWRKVCAVLNIPE